MPKKIAQEVPAPSVETITPPKQPAQVRLMEFLQREGIKLEHSYKIHLHPEFADILDPVIAKGISKGVVLADVTVVAKDAAAQA